MNSNDLLAKLLANEDLTVVRGNVTTASFQIDKRVLVLPQWKEIANTTEEMLILHEVGHALYTTTEYGNAQEGKDRAYGHYLNVVEDARIERKMKHRYPGARKSFTAGYKELMARDFFEIKDTDVQTMSFIDRINLFYKLGVSCGIKFNSNEMKFINEIDKVESLKEVIDISDRLYQYCKENAETQVRLQMLENIDSDDGDDFEDEDYDDFDNQLEGGNFESEEEDVGDNSGKKAAIEERKQEVKDNIEKAEIDKKIKATTVSALENNLQSSADANTNYQYFEPAFSYTTSDNPIIAYKRVLSEMKDEMLRRHDNLIAVNRKAQTFREENNSVVNNMVKEFEMRKSASNWKRAQTSKTGQLDAKKLFGYRIKDELFKQLTVVKDGKQHGMILLLDWSGSMDSYMSNTVAQLINLVMFARRINVPFQVFAFSSNYFKDINYESLIENENGIGKSYQFTLFELFSSKMNERETSEMSSYLLNKIWLNCGNGQFSLSGTPLNEALVFMTDYVGKFISNNAVEKTIFITLTDGEGGPLSAHNKKSLYESSYTDYRRTVNKNFIKDSRTGKQYQITEDAEVQAHALLNIIKDRYNTINIGFNLISNNYSSVNRFVVKTSGNKSINTYDIQSKLRANKFTEIAVSGYSKYYLADNKSIGVQNDVNLDTVNNDMNAAAVSKALGKVMNKNKTSRIILNNFVAEIA
jgi:hypothetical protein